MEYLADTVRNFGLSPAYFGNGYAHTESRENQWDYDATGVIPVALTGLLPSSGEKAICSCTDPPRGPITIKGNATT